MTKLEIKGYLLRRREIVHGGCWQLKGRSTPYPTVRFRKVGSRRFLCSHLAAWAWLGFDLNRVSPQYQINHTCDNGKCWNPSHLEIGSQSKNMRDAYSRIPSMAKKRRLDERGIRRIMRMQENGTSHADIINSMSKELHVHRSTVWAVLKGRNWGWLTNYPKQ